MEHNDFKWVDIIGELFYKLERVHQTLWIAYGFTHNPNTIPVEEATWDELQARQLLLVSAQGETAREALQNVWKIIQKK